MKSYWILGCVALFLAGCGESKPYHSIQLFDLNGNLNVKADTTKTWNDFASSVQIIPLETNDSVLLASYTISAVDGDKIIGINRVINKTSDGWFVISGAKADIRIFSTEGKQLQKIDRLGKGAEEYTDLGRLLVSKNPLTIQVRDNKRLLSYNDKGEYLRTDSLKRNFFNMVSLDERRYLAEAAVFPVEEYRYLLGIFNNEGGIEKELLPVKCDTTKLARMPFTVYGVLRPAENGAFYKNPYSDTLYQVTSGLQVNPLAVFLCGERNYSKMLDIQPGRDWNVLLDVGKELISINDYAVWGKYIFLSYFCKQNYYEIWEKGGSRPLVRKTGKQENGGITLNIGNGSIDLFPQFFQDGKAYFIVDAYRLLDIVEGITEDSNPVLIIVTVDDK